MRRTSFILAIVMIMVTGGIFITAYTNKTKSIGSVLSTDIVTYIDRVPIVSYDYLGSIYVMAEDLRGYGFDVIWDKTSRTVSVTFPQDGHTENFTAEEKTALGIRQPGGKKIFDVYPADIKINFNGTILPDTENGAATAINADNKILLSFDVPGEHFGTMNYNDQQRTISLATPKDSLVSVESAVHFPEIELQYEETIPFDAVDFSISKSETAAADVDLGSEELMNHRDRYVISIISFTADDISAGKSKTYFLFSPALIDTFHLEAKKSEENAVTLETTQELVELQNANVLLSFQPTFLYETSLSLYTTDGKRVEDFPFPCFLSIDGKLYINASALAESLGMTHMLDLYGYGEGTFEKRDASL